MKVIIDCREKSLYDKCWLINETLKNSFVEIESRNLPLGDILLESDEGRPVWIVERKSLQDLLASIKDGRYEEQSFRLKNAAEYPRHNVIYIIEGMYSQLQSPQQKRVILSTMASLQYFKGFTVFRTCSTQETAELLVYMGDKIDRKFQKRVLPYVYRWSGTAEDSYGEGIIAHQEKPILHDLSHNVQQNEIMVTEETVNTTNTTNTTSYCTVVKKVKKENITKENIGEIFLSQVPGISSTTAISIMEVCNGSVKKLIHYLEENPSIIEEIKIGNGDKKKRISKNAVAKLKEYFLV